MWQYSQSTGDLSDANGFIVATCYSGHGAGVNNPAMQQCADVGPIPQGLYSLGAPVNDPDNPASANAELAHLGPFAITLIPHDGNQMFGRSGFYIHGDDIHELGQRAASLGCIVAPPDARRQLWNSTDHVLSVIP